MGPDLSVSYSFSDRRGAFARSSPEKMHNLSLAAKPAAGRHHVKPQLCANYVRNNAGATFSRVRTAVQFSVYVSEFAARRYANVRK
jgi:hypothetical protein